MNNDIKYKQTYIFLKKTIFNIKLNITLKSYATFIKQNTKKQKIEEQIKKNHKNKRNHKTKEDRGGEKNRETIQQSQFGFENPQNALKSI